MLPPFVPPSARISTEDLPLITEFVVTRTERSFEAPTAFDIDRPTRPEAATAALPSIDEFVMAPASVATQDGEPNEHDEFVQKTSRSSSGTYEASRERREAASAPPQTSSADALGADILLVGHHAPTGSEDAVVNQTVEPLDAWTASASGGARPTGDQSTGKRTGADDNRTPAASQSAPEEWVSQERDAFDWKSAANLAVQPADEQRAAEEWSSTEWDRTGGTMQDHVAAMLANVARRVRSGELEVQGSKQMGTEAALVSVLAALLAESSK